MTKRTTRNSLMGFYGVAFAVCALASVAPPNMWAAVCALAVAVQAGLIWEAMKD